MRILVVVKEKRLATTIKESLVHGKYFVDVVEDGETGLDYARSDIYDGLILDHSLPVIDGVQVSKILREEGIATPVLFLCSPEVNEPGYYYLEKPFSKDALLQAVRDLLYAEGKLSQEEISFGDLTLDLAGAILHCQENSLALSAREFELARLLMTCKDSLLPKETIFLKIWGYDSEAESNVVEAYVSFLRRKLKQLRSEVRLQVMRRKGYHLCWNENQDSVIE